MCRLRLRCKAKRPDPGILPKFAYFDVDHGCDSVESIEIATAGPLYSPRQCFVESASTRHWLTHWRKLGDAGWQERRGKREERVCFEVEGTGSAGEREDAEEKLKEVREVER